MPNAYYLKLGSATEQVPGGSRDKCHEGWIKLELVLDGRHEQDDRAAQAAEPERQHSRTSS